jgi:hypothetical protein
MSSQAGDSQLSKSLALVLWAVFAAYVVYVASMFIGGYRAAATGGIPWYTDFTQTYAVSLVVREAGAIFLFADEPIFLALVDTARLAFGPELSSRQALAAGGVATPWMYPPTFIFCIAPLAFMPYLAAYLAWIVATAIPYLAAMRQILSDGSAWRNAWPIALASPTTYSNLMYGQTGFLSAGFIGLGLHLIQARPLLAGTLIGLASVKPHLGLLIPVALAAGGHWRVFASATATTLGLAGASAMVYGLEPWAATVGSLGYYAEGFAAGGYSLLAMTSVLSTVRLPGGSAVLMWTVQGFATALMVVLIAGIWWRGRRRPESLGLQSAILCFATPLAIPACYVYDLALLMPGVAWLWLDLRSRGGHRREYACLIVALVVPMFSYELARVSGVQIGAAAPFGLLMLALYRQLAFKPAAISD